MKKTLRVLMLLGGLYLACVGASEVLAQKPQIPVVGGYQETSRESRDVRAAARFAVSRERQKHGGRASLISVARAETQVVAGVNYRLCLRVKVRGKIQNVVAVVYRDLRGRYSLSDWKVESCQKK